VTIEVDAEKLPSKKEVAEAVDTILAMTCVRNGKDGLLDYLCPAVEPEPS
jgi:hypothetical protein